MREIFFQSNGKHQRCDFSRDQGLYVEQQIYCRSWGGKTKALIKSRKPKMRSLLLVTLRWAFSIKSHFGFLGFYTNQTTFQAPLRFSPRGLLRY